MRNEKELPLVSVIITNYNYGRYVKDAIESVVNQTYKNIELIVIDDSSQDDSVKIIKDLANKYNFTFISHEINKGHHFTLSEGIKQSKGKYVYPLDSDDMLLPNTVEKHVEFMESNPQYMMSYGKVIIIDSDNNIKEYADNKRAKGGWIFEDLIYENFIPFPAKLLRREVFDDIGYLDENILIADWDMWLRIAYKYQIGYIDDYLGYYRIHSSNTTKNTAKLYESEMLTLNKWKHYEKINEVMAYRTISWFFLPPGQSSPKIYDTTKSLIDNAIKTLIGSSRDIYIYGAGWVGTRLYDLYKEYLDDKLIAFIDDNKQGYILDKKIISYEDLKDLGKDATVFISAMYQNDIDNMLEKLKKVFKGNIVVIRDVIKEAIQ